MAGTKTRVFALLMTLIMIIAAVLFGGMRSLTKLRNQAVEEAFSNGGYELDQRANEAINLMDIIYEYEHENYSSVMWDCYDAIFAVQDTDSISAKLDANEQLSAMIEKVYVHLYTLNLTEAERTEADYIYDKLMEMDAALVGIEPTDAEKKFNKVLDEFPANVIAQITGVDAL